MCTCASVGNQNQAPRKTYVVETKSIALQTWLSIGWKQDISAGTRGPKIAEVNANRWISKMLWRLANWKVREREDALVDCAEEPCAIELWNIKLGEHISYERVIFDLEETRLYQKYLRDGHEDENDDLGGWWEFESTALWQDRNCDNSDHVAIRLIRQKKRWLD